MRFENVWSQKPNKEFQGSDVTARWQKPRMISWMKQFDLQPYREEERVKWKTVSKEERNIVAKEAHVSDNPSKS